jgi:hypothetical protein
MMAWNEMLGTTAAVFMLVIPAVGLAQEIGGCETNCAATSCCCNDRCVEPKGQSCNLACALADAQWDGKDMTRMASQVGSYKGPFSRTANGDYLLAGKVTIPKENVSQKGDVLSIWLSWSASSAKSTFTWPPKTRAAAHGSGLHYFHMCKVCGGRGSCEATWCVGSGSHVDCKGAKVNTSCDSWL